MDQKTIQHFRNLHSEDGDSRYRSFQEIIGLTDTPVDWAYQVWGELLQLIVAGDNHQRTIAVQILANLAKSDPEKKMLADLGKLMAVTKDEKFVTARHSLQCLWKIGIVDREFRTKLVDQLAQRFKESLSEKNSTLIRYDIMVVMRTMYDHTNDEALPAKAELLISTEADVKYKKKYYSAWRKILSAK